MEIIAWIFGIGAMICLFSVYQQKDRKKLIVSKLSADVCWVIHYLCLGAYAGMIPNFVGIFRELVFVRRERDKWADRIIWPVLFILINWALGFRTFSSIFNILPIAASTAVTISLWLRNVRLTKIISIPVSTAFIIYDICVGSWIGIINESIALCSILISFIREKKTKEQA